MFFVEIFAKRSNEFFWCVQRSVGRIGGEITKEWLVTTLVNEIHRFIKEQIFAEPLFLFTHSVANHDRIKMLTRSLRVRRAPVETTTSRFVTGAATKMPFADKPRVVTSGLQQIRQRCRILVQVFARDQRMSDPAAKFMHPRQQRRSRRRTGWADIKVIKPHAFIIKSISVRRLQQRMTVSTKITVALIIGQDEQDVGLLGWFGFCLFCFYLSWDSHNSDQEH